MDQIRRIMYMEEILDEGTKVLSDLRKALDAYDTMGPRLEELFEYYTGEQWKQDFADDSDGKLPADLKRGVLSQDGIHLLLSERKRLEERMKP